MDLPRRSRLDRVPARRLRSPCGVRRGGRGVRTLARARRVPGAAAEMHRRPPHPAHHFRQQDRLGGSPRARHAVGAAVGVDAQAGPAPGADPPADRQWRRGDGGLRRPRERARLSLQEQRRFRSDRDAGRDPAARIGGPPRTPGNALRVRRHAAGAAHRRHRAGEIPDLPRSPRRIRRRQDRAGTAGRRRSRERRAPAPEGVAPRHTVRRRNRQTPVFCRQWRRPRHRQWNGGRGMLQSLASVACRQALAVPGVVGNAHRRPVARRPSHRHDAAAVRPTPRQDRRSPQRRARGARQARCALGGPCAGRDRDRPVGRFSGARACGVRPVACRQEPQRRGQAFGRPAQDRRGGSVACLRGARRNP